MQGLRILLVIIGIVSIVSNYKKANEKRVYEQRMKAAALRKRVQEDNENTVVSNETKEHVPSIIMERSIERSSKPAISPSKPAVTVSEMRKAIVVSEILAKPVSLRDE